MYNILIVDDEYWVGRWLQTVLEKSPFEVEITGVCQDGEEALRVLKSGTVDILITDIHMPVLTGLELIRQVRETGRQAPKTIVISGYDEFEYARQAIELEVLTYLLKPLEREAVFGALEKAIDSLNQERRQQEEARSGYHAMVENILLELLLRQPKDSLKNQLEEIFGEQGLKGQYYAVGIIQNASLETSMIAKEHLQEKLETACRSRHVFLVRRDAHTWGFLVAGIGKPAGYYVDSSVLLQILSGYSWGISVPRKDFMEIGEAAKEAAGHILMRMKDEPVPSSCILESEMKSACLAAIESRDKKRVAECACAQEEIFLKPPCDTTSCLNFYFILTGEILELLTESYKHSKDLAVLELIDEGYEFCVQIRKFYSIRPICRKFLEYSLKVVDCLREAGPMTVSEIVLKVQKIIREQYASNLSLGLIADEFDINSSYFSKKFKDETGVNFVDYLSGVRIEQAKSLLEHTELPVSKISSQVGFHDSKYFSRVFLSVVGMKPSEYRILCRGGEG